MTGQLAGRPPPLRRPSLPLLGRDGICRAQKLALCTRQILDDGRKGWHGSSTHAKKSQTAAPPACSKACASCNTRASPKAVPKICNPTGSFSSILPHGTEIPGTPASDPVTVYISARYICSGSFVRSPNLNGATGELVVQIPSTFLTPSRQSCPTSTPA